MPSIPNRYSTVTIPLGIVLPYYARPDLAWVDTVSLGVNGANVTQFIYTVSTQLEIPLAVQATVTTSATAGNRNITLLFQDSDHDTIIDLFAPIAQPPSTIFQYEWLANVDTTIATSGLTNAAGISAVVQAPIPAILLYPQHRLLLSEFTPAFTDTAQTVFYSRILIPTGPPVETVQSSKIPDPILL